MQVENIGNKLINEVDLLKLKTDTLETRQDMMLENFNDLKKVVEDQDDWIDGLIDLVEEQDREIMASRVENFISGIIIIVIGVALIIIAHKLGAVYDIL